MVRCAAAWDAVLECIEDWLPNPRRDWLVFVKAYIERGQRPDADGIMSIGCSVFSGEPYKRFVRAWKQHLRALNNAPYIHAADFYGGWDIYKPIRVERRNKVAKLLPATVRRYAKFHGVVSFKADEFAQVAGQKWAERFGTPYTAAVQLAMGAVGHWCDANKYHGRISYFYESGDPEEAELTGILARLPEYIRRHTRMLTAAPMPKGSARGLESADVLSWHWNKFYAESMARDGVPTLDPLKVWRPPRKDTIALFGAGPGTRPEIYLFTGDELEYVLARLWDPSTPVRPDYMRRSSWKSIREYIMRAAK